MDDYLYVQVCLFAMTDRTEDKRFFLSFLSIWDKIYGSFLDGILS